MKKNKLFIIVFSFILTIFSICNILFINNGLNKINLEISVDKKDSKKDIIINDFYINYNDYMVEDLFNIEKRKIMYNRYERIISYDFNEKFIYKISKNDLIDIRLDSKNIKNIDVSLDNKKIDTKIINDKIITRHDVNIINILKEQYNKVNLFLILLLGITFTLLYYYLITYIISTIHKIFDNKVKIINIVIAMITLFYIYYLNFYSMITILNMYLIILIFSIINLSIYFNRKKINLTSVFLIIIMFLGITIMYLIPPFHVLDEDNHYIKTYDHLFFIEGSHADRNKTTISNNMYHFLIKYQNTIFNLDDINSLDYYNDMINKVEYKDLNENEVWFGTYSSMKLAYIPSNIITFICKRLNTSVLFTFMMGRFINLLLATILCYLAIKIIPICKPLLFTIMTFGICIQSLMGVNQDWLNTSTCFLSIAFILSLIYRKKDVIWKDYLILVLLAVSLAFSKTVYTPLFLMILLINNNKLGKYPYLKKFGIIGFAFSLTLLSYFWNNIFCPEILIPVTGPSGHYTLSELIKDPYLFYFLYRNTFVLRASRDLLCEYFNGYAWYSLWNFEIVKNIIMYIYLFLIFTFPKEKFIKEKKTKLLFFFIFVIIYLIVASAMLFNYSSNELHFIDGLQARYFIPVIFLLYIVVNNNILKIKNNKIYQIILITIILLINFLSFFTIAYRLFM